MLSKPDVLLCDEPTASLDFENAKLDCELLKKVSQEIAVIVITHDVSLMSDYSDTILKLTNHQIVIEKAGPIRNSKTEKIRTKEIRNDWKEYYHMAFLTIKAHLASSLCTIILLFMILFSFYNIYYYTNASTSSLQKDRWFYSNNLVQLTSKSIKYDPQLDRMSKQYMDAFPLKEVKDVFNQRDDIVAYTLQFELYYSDRINGKDIDEIAQSFPTTKYDDNFIYQFPIIPFVTLNELNPGISAITDSSSWVYLYQIVHEEAIPLAYGSYPQHHDEVLLNSDLAESIVQKMDIKDMQQLIGKTVTLCSDFHFSTNDKLNVSFIVSGITELENCYENRMFFMDDVIPAIYANIYGYDESSVEYNVVKFLVDPKINIQQFVDEMNASFDLKNSLFSDIDFYRDFIDEKQNIGRFNTNLVVLSYILLSILSFSGIIYLKFFYKEQFEKENKICVRYHYKPLYIYAIANSLLAFAALIFGWIGVPCMVFLVNQGSTKFLHRSLLHFDWQVILFSSLLTIAVYMVSILLVTNRVMSKKVRK